MSPHDRAGENRGKARRAPAARTNRPLATRSPAAKTRSRQPNTPRVDKRLLLARGMTDNNLFGPDEVNPRPLGGTPLVRAKGFGLEVILDDAPTWVAVFWEGEVPSGRAEIRGWDAAQVKRMLGPHVGEVLVTLDLSEIRLDLNNPAAILAALTVVLPSNRETFSGDLPPGARWSWLPPACLF